jgi:opacity protein-like surface antigen
VFKDAGGGMNGRFGIGVDYHVAGGVELRVDVQQTQDFNRGFLTFGGFPLSFDGDLTTVSLGLRYRFQR